MTSYLFLTFTVLLLQANPIDRFCGAFKGTARNQSGVLQLGGASANTIFQLQHIADSVRLSALSLNGSDRVIAAWPVSRVNVSGESLTATGLAKGPLRLRRTCTWTQTAGLRVQATIRTQGASQTSDDYFGGSEVAITAIKVR